MPSPEWFFPMTVAVGGNCERKVGFFCTHLGLPVGLKALPKVGAMERPKLCLKLIKIY